MTDRVVLAYSGGLDTSVALQWLKEHKGYDTIACAVDVGQEGADIPLQDHGVDDRAPLRAKPLPRFRHARDAFHHRGQAQHQAHQRSLGDVAWIVDAKAEKRLNDIARAVKGEKIGTLVTSGA